MIYTVKRIEEDLDFGCEERSEDSPVMAVVTLVDPDGKEERVKAVDAMLYERGIDRGDRVWFDGEGTLEKVRDEDLTKDRNNTLMVFL